MITIMYGVWADQPKTFNTIGDYLEENKVDIENEVSEYFKHIKCDKTFELNSKVKDFITDYVGTHKESAYLRKDGAFLPERFYLLCADAIYSYLQETNYLAG